MNSQQATEQILAIFEESFVKSGLAPPGQKFSPQLYEQVKSIVDQVNPNAGSSSPQKGNNVKESYYPTSFYDLP